MSSARLAWIALSLVVSSSLGVNERNVSVEAEESGKPEIESSPGSYADAKTLAGKVSINGSISDVNNENPRDKRALGVILQGLAEAFGYTVSPISVSSLPNPNTTASMAAAAPATVFTFPGIATPPPVPPMPPRAPPMPAATPPPRPVVLQKPNPPTQVRPGQMPIAPSGNAPMTPRQRETLRLTGVVNFGNNSNLLDHLRQYERLFHGGTTTAAPPVQTTPSKPPISGGTNFVATPLFVQIPIPIAPNLQPVLPASAPRHTQQMTFKESYESQEIQDEENVREKPTQSDTYIDEPDWLKKEREQKRNQYRESDEDSEENRPNGGPHRQTANDEEPENKRNEDSHKDSNVYKHDERENDDDDDNEEEQGDSRERYQDQEQHRPSKDSEEEDEDRRANENGDNDREAESHRPYKSHQEIQDFRNPRDNYSTGFEQPYPFSPQKLPLITAEFGTRLPITVYSPYNHQDEIRDSYGHILVHDGRVDDSLADYFQGYRQPEPQVYDSRRILSVEPPRRSEAWWLNYPYVAQPETDSFKRLRQEYAPSSEGENEEHSSPVHPARRKAPARKRIRGNDAEDAFTEDEKAEPTVTSYVQIVAPNVVKENKHTKKNDDGDDDDDNDDDDDDDEEARDGSKTSPGTIELSKKRPYNPIPANAINFLNPYFRPLQISYEPEKLERTAEQILSSHDRVEHRKIEPLKKMAAPKYPHREPAKNRAPEKHRNQPEVDASGKTNGSAQHRKQSKGYDSYERTVPHVCVHAKLPEATDPTYEYRNSKQSRPEVNRQDEDEAEEHRALDNPRRGKNGEPEADRSPVYSGHRELEKDEPEVHRSSDNLRDQEHEEEESEEERSRNKLRDPEHEDDEPEVNRYPEHLRDRESEEDEPEVYRSPEHQRDRGSEEDEPEVYRSPETLREDENEEDEREVYRSPENQREDENEENEREVYRSPENLREDKNEADEPEVNQPPKNLRDRESEEDEPEVQRSPNHSREHDSEEEPEVHPSPEHQREHESKNRKSEEDDSLERFRDDFNDETKVYRPENSPNPPIGRPKVTTDKPRGRHHYKPEVGLPERLTGRKLHEEENKEFRGWPAPFDFTFDSTESTKILKIPNYSSFHSGYVKPTTYRASSIYKKYFGDNSNDNYYRKVSPTFETPSSVESRKFKMADNKYTRDSIVAPTRVTSITDKSADDKLSTNPEKRHPDKFSINRSRTNFSIIAKRHEDPENSKKDDERIKNPWYDLQKIPAIKTQKDGVQNGDLPDNPRRSYETPNKHEKSHEPEVTKNPTVSTRETTPLPVRSRPFEDPESAREFFGLSQDDYNLDGKVTSGRRKILKKTSSPSITSRLKNANKEELIKLLDVKPRQDPHYRRDVELTEFSDEPETETEKVRVNEYRNKIATIKVSERKELSPVGIVKLVGFTRHF